MPWPYGGSMTHCELAEKFGWAQMIVSILLLPITILYTRLLSFPIWLDWMGDYYGRRGRELGIELLKEYGCEQLNEELKEQLKDEKTEIEKLDRKYKKKHDAISTHCCLLSVNAEFSHKISKDDNEFREDQIEIKERRRQLTEYEKKCEKFEQEKIKDSTEESIGKLIDTLGQDFKIMEWWGKKFKNYKSKLGEDFVEKLLLERFLEDYNTHCVETCCFDTNEKKGTRIEDIEDWYLLHKDTLGMSFWKDFKEKKQSLDSNGERKDWRQRYLELKKEWKKELIKEFLEDRGTDEWYCRYKNKLGKDFRRYCCMHYNNFDSEDAQKLIEEYGQGHGTTEWFEKEYGTKLYERMIIEELFAGHENKSWFKRHKKLFKKIIEECLGDHEKMSWFKCGKDFQPFTNDYDSFLKFKKGYDKAQLFNKQLRHLKSKPKYTVGNELHYDLHDDLYKNNFYEVEKRVSDFPTGWNCLIDKEGGKFFESFWGIINCLDLVAKDENGDPYSLYPCLEGYDHAQSGYMHITSNSLSWLRVSAVFVEFSIKTMGEDEEKRSLRASDSKKGGVGGCYGHRIRFFFPLDGINKYNPFTWFTIGHTVFALTYFSKKSFRRWKSIHEVEATQFSPIPNIGLKWPEGPNSILQRSDGSIPYMKDEEEVLSSTRRGSSSLARPAALLSHQRSISSSGAVASRSINEEGASEPFVVNERTSLIGPPRPSAFGSGGRSVSAGVF
mmetsp:Transcript_874/g.2017  ORF Transcript_874/g.2017 Transcript_874/m.2017 type:complete len:724 (-) Transcript_874:344-2515(-)